MHYFSIFFENLIYHPLIFRAFGRKAHSWEIFLSENLSIFYKNSIEKLNFKLSGNFIRKIEPYEITSFSYNIFSVSGDFPHSPLATPLLSIINAQFHDIPYSLIYQLSFRVCYCLLSARSIIYFVKQFLMKTNWVSKQTSQSVFYISYSISNCFIKLHIAFKM